jgi:hypothetical protein
MMRRTVMFVRMKNLNVKMGDVFVLSGYAMEWMTVVMVQMRIR